MKCNLRRKHDNKQIIVIIALSILLSVMSIILVNKSLPKEYAYSKSHLNNLHISTLTMQVEKKVINVIAPLIDDFVLLHPTIEITETNDYMYTTDYVHYRIAPNLEADIIDTLCPGEEIYRIGICDNGWSKVLITNIECYMHSDFLSSEKPIVQVNTTIITKYSPEYLLNMGVVYDGGWKYTWYSEKVLPGGGLNIPGRWSDGNFVRDESNYICVASSDLSKGTVLETPWGTAKVYDCGCASGTIDIYVSW